MGRFFILKVFNKMSFSPGGNTLQLKKGKKKRNGKTEQDRRNKFDHCSIGKSIVLADSI